MTELNNQSENVFTAIDTEAYREYDFSEATVRLDAPLYLSVSASGGHRVFTADGVSHYIPTGWTHLSWRAKPDAPHFVK